VKCDVTHKVRHCIVVLNGRIGQGKSSTLGQIRGDHLIPDEKNNRIDSQGCNIIEIANLILRILLIGDHRGLNLATFRSRIEGNQVQFDIVVTHNQ
jgi:hypothetical protein